MKHAIIIIIFLLMINTAIALNLNAGTQFTPSLSNTTYNINTTQTSITYVKLNETCLEIDGTSYCNTNNGTIQLFEPTSYPPQIYNVTIQNVTQTSINTTFTYNGTSTQKAIIYLNNQNIANITYSNNTYLFQNLTCSNPYTIQFNSWNSTNGENNNVIQNQIVQNTLLCNTTIVPTTNLIVGYFDSFVPKVVIENTISNTSGTSCTSCNSSWNQTLTDSLYAPIGSTGSSNSSWNQTLADSLYLFVNDQRYNDTLLSSSIGNWSKDKSGLPNLSMSQVSTGLGNFSANNASLWTNITNSRIAINNLQVYNTTLNAQMSSLTNLSMTQIFTGLGNFSANNVSIWSNASDQATILGNLLTADKSFLINASNANLKNLTITDTLIAVTILVENVTQKDSMTNGTFCIQDPVTKTCQVTLYTNGNGSFNKNINANSNVSIGSNLCFGTSCQTSWGFATTLGNWSADKSGLVNLTMAQAFTGLGNFSANNASLWTAINNLQTANITINNSVTSLITKVNNLQTANVTTNTSVTNLISKVNGINNASNLWQNSSNNATFSLGNVGIGTTAPKTLLNVHSTGNTTMSLTSTVIGTAGNQVGLIMGYTDSTYQKAAMYFQSQDGNGRGAIKFALEPSADSRNVNITNTVMTLNYTGNVGINSTNPSTALEVNGNINVSASGGCVYVFGGGKICGNTTSINIYAPGAT